jgi:hypothetical protein
MKKILTSLSLLLLLACNNEAGTTPAPADGTAIADTPVALPPGPADTVVGARADTLPARPVGARPASVSKPAKKVIAVKPVKEAHIDKKALKDALDTARQ